jgi:hypothetical protein
MKVKTLDQIQKNQPLITSIVKYMKQTPNQEFFEHLLKV